MLQIKKTTNCLIFVGKEIFMPFWFFLKKITTDFENRHNTISKQKQMHWKVEAYIYGHVLIVRH